MALRIGGAALARVVQRNPWVAAAADGPAAWSAAASASQLQPPTTAPACTPSMLPQSCAAAARWFAAQPAAVDVPAAVSAPSAVPCELKAAPLQRNALDEELEAAGAVEGADGVLRVAEARGEQLTESNVVTAFRELAGAARRGGGMPAGVLGQPSLQGLVDAVLLGLGRFPSAALGEVLGACADLEVTRDSSIDMLLDEIGRHVMRSVDELGPAEVAAFVGSYARLDYSPGAVLFDSLAARAAALGRATFPVAERHAVSAGLRQLGYADKDPFLHRV
eukprot:scaffold1.g5188.t1